MEMDGIGMVGTLIENGPSGNPITDYYTARVAEAVQGCPFCGCTNI
jgi:hypothetical protein